MAARFLPDPVETRLTNRLYDITVTLTCWTYFTLGFLLLFSPFYIATCLFTSRPEYYFQRLNRAFYRGFFFILKKIAPRQKWDLDVNIGQIRSSIIVCNHLSYLDPLLLIALLDRSKTIVKPVFFSVPIFGWVIRTAGYFPEAATKHFAQIMLKQMETMAEYLEGGGNLFIFPEGTRNRSGSIGTLNQGALKIARYCKAPIYILCLRNTNKLFTPGKFFFSTRQHNTISVRIADHLVLDPQKVSLADLSARIHRSLEGCLQDRRQSENHQTVVSSPPEAEQ